MSNVPFFMCLERFTDPKLQTAVSSFEVLSVISDTYINAWKMGIKTTYYLRTEAASSIEKSTVDINNTIIEPDGTQKKIEVYETNNGTSVQLEKEQVPTQLDPKFCNIKGRDLADGEVCESCQ